MWGCFHCGHGNNVRTELFPTTVGVMREITNIAQTKRDGSPKGGYAMKQLLLDAAAQSVAGIIVTLFCFWLNLD